MQQARESLLQVLANRRILVILLLGFSSGLPIALTAGTLQAWLADGGINIKTISAFSLCGLPYTWKFLWAPMLDRYSLPFLGRRRGWILVCQILLAVCMALYALMQPAVQVTQIAMLVFVLAFISATQDIAFDAYRTDILLPEERGVGSAAVVAGYRVAMIVSGALTLIAADQVGWQKTFFGVSVVMLLATGATLLAPEPGRQVAKPRTLLDAVWYPLNEFLRRNPRLTVTALLLLMVFYKLGDALALSLSTPFLKILGFTNTDIGAVSKGFGLVSTIAGAFLGGLVLAKIRLYKALLCLGLAQAITILPYIWLSQVGHSYVGLFVVIGIQNFGDGMGTAAFVALLTALCDVRFGAFQYALFSALASQGRILFGPLAGGLSQLLGWSRLYLLCLFICIPGLLLVYYLRFTLQSLDSSAD